MVSSNARIGRVFAWAWSHMQEELGEPTPGCTLARPVAEAGRSCYRVQAALTRIRGRHAYQLLDVDMRALPDTDVRKMAWLNTNRYSAAWVSAWPMPDLWLHDTEFSKVTCRYFGLASPACTLFAGQCIGRTRTRLDAWVQTVFCGASR